MNILPLVTITFLGCIALQSCCEPRVKDSDPQIIYESYTDSVIKDQWPGSAATQRDSGYYPVYRFLIKNRGSEGDTFKITMIATNDSGVTYGFQEPIYVAGGETKLFSTPDNLRDTSDVPAQWYYYTFFRREKDIDKLPIYVMRPSITISYGEVYNGPEGCNTGPREVSINATRFEP